MHETPHTKYGLKGKRRISEIADEMSLKITDKHGLKLSGVNFEPIIDRSQNLEWKNLQS